MEINRADIFYAVLNEDVVGSEQTGIRPVVILQNNVGNLYSPTVIIAPITSKVKVKSKLPTHIFIDEKSNGLPKDSLILLEQIRVIDKSRIRNYIGHIGNNDMKEIDIGIIIALGIDLNKALKDAKYFEKLALEKEEKTEFITRKQVSSYGIVAKEYLKNTGNLEISNKLFGEYILTLMELYSPEEIEKQADNIIKKGR